MLDRTYRLLDHRVRLRAPSPVGNVVGSALAALAEPASSDDVEEVLTVVEAGEPGRWSFGSTGTADPPGRFLARLLEHLNQRAAASLRAELPMHAAAVCDARGRAILLAGTSGAGKSTLAAAAVRAGRGFLADEVSAVDPDTLAIRPYHRPIGLRRGGARAIGVDYPSGDWYGDVYPWPVIAADRADHAIVSGIAVVRRSDEAATPDPLSPAAALAELLQHTVVPDDDRVVPVFRQLERLVARVPVVRLSYRVPADGVATIDALLQQWART